MDGTETAHRKTCFLNTQRPSQIYLSQAELACQHGKLKIGSFDKACVFPHEAGAKHRYLDLLPFLTGHEGSTLFGTHPQLMGFLDVMALLDCSSDLPGWIVFCVEVHIKITLL